MKITFLGTSHGVPQPGRRCSCTMIQTGGNTYFIDMGISPINDMMEMDVDIGSVKGIFITHPHSDHTDGMAEYCSLLSWFFTDRERFDPKIYIPYMKLKDGIVAFFAAQSGNLYDFKFTQIDPGVIYDDGVLRVTAYPTLHCQPRPSYAFLLEAEGKRVLFTGDIAHPTKDFPISVFDAPLDLLVCEGAHFHALDYLDTLKGRDIKKICPNHYVDPNIPAFEELKNALGADLTLATDRMEVIV